MEKPILINHTKPNNIEFDIETSGIDDNKMVVRFVIQVSGMDISFKAKNMEGGKWVVKIPALPMLDKTTYNYKIEAIADGYFFEPSKGTINVVGSAELYTTTPKNTTYAPAKVEQDTSSSKKPKGSTNKKEKDPVSEQIASNIMSTQKHFVTEKRNTTTAAEDKVLSILEDLGINTSKHKKRSGTKKLGLRNNII